MASWISVYSRFTSEALLFQALIITALCAGYAAFWVLRKRRFGVAGDAIPAGVVKSYLSELIRDAETMRAQLFGLLRSAGAQIEPQFQGTPLTSDQISLPTGANYDQALIQKITLLEARMTEQARAMEGILTEKKKIEAELAQARAASANTGGGGADPSLLAELQEKIKALEGRLAEYSIIEDDLANLKRLQQENTQLRTALQNAGLSAPEPVVASAPAATAAVVEPTLTEPATEPAAQAAGTPTEAAASEAPPASEAPASAEGAAAPDAAVAEAAGALAATADPSFEGLVDQVEQSLQPAVPLEAASAEASPAAPDLSEKSDADLVAEFEKMLKS